MDQTTCHPVDDRLVSVFMSNSIQSFFRDIKESIRVLAVAPVKKSRNALIRAFSERAQDFESLLRRLK